MIRALRGEIAKLRSARVIVPILVVPAGFVLLKGSVFFLRGEEGLGADRYTFEYLFSIGRFFWDRLLIPLLAVTICAWLVWLESENGNWKLLLVQPLPRASFYGAKLVVACAGVFLLQGGWWMLHGLVGLALDLGGRETVWTAGLQALRVALALTPLIGVQLLLSFVLRNPLAALGVGVVGNLASLVLAGTAINHWHPWGLAQVAGQAEAAAWTLGVAVAAAAALFWAGAVTFSRRDV